MLCERLLSFGQSRVGKHKVGEKNQLKNYFGVPKIANKFCIINFDLKLQEK